MQFRFFGQPKDGFDGEGLQQFLETAFQCPSTNRLFAGLFSSPKKIPMSVFAIDMEEHEDCGGDTTGKVVFPASNRNLVWLCELIQYYSTLTTCLHSCFEAFGKKSMFLVAGAARRLFVVLRGVGAADMTAEFQLPTSSQMPHNFARYPRIYMRIDETRRFYGSAQVDHADKFGRRGRGGDHTC